MLPSVRTDKSNSNGEMQPVVLSLRWETCSSPGPDNKYSKLSQKITGSGPSHCSSYFLSGDPVIISGAIPNVGSPASYFLSGDFSAGPLRGPPRPKGPSKGPPNTHLSLFDSRDPAMSAPPATHTPPVIFYQVTHFSFQATSDFRGGRQLFFIRRLLAECQLFFGTTYCTLWHLLCSAIVRCNNF